MSKVHIEFHEAFLEFTSAVCVLGNLNNGDLITTRVRDLFFIAITSRRLWDSLSSCPQGTSCSFSRGNAVQM
jgi:hypothetical protein